MLVIRANNVNDAYSDALWALRNNYIEEESRNGKARTYPTPVTTVYSKPCQRMLYDTDRNANPFFHIMESIWMLAGRNDVEFVNKYAGNMGDFSDDGHTLNGAYGYRWRKHFGRDQIQDIIELLKSDPNTRRAVVAMWDPDWDLGMVTKSKDVPCNTHIYFRIKGGALQMTVANRSNDIIWGCYGANAVHMSMLQEFVANALGIPVGLYNQVSNDWHIYERHFGLLDAPKDPPYNAYTKDWVHVDLLENPNCAETFLRECNNFTKNMLEVKLYESYQSAYINWVLQPLAKSWLAYKDGDIIRALRYAGTIKDTAIAMACIPWLERKIK